MPPPPVLPDGSAAPGLTVMSVNVRIPVDSGDAAWEVRRPLLARIIRDADPDVLGTQELRAEHGDWLVAQLEETRWFGRGRSGSPTPGAHDERMGILYRSDRLELIESGDFWLSDRPDEAGSATWNTEFPRMVTWGRFRLRTGAAAGRELLFADTHLAHRPEDERARLRSAELIAARLAELARSDAGRLPVVLTGDFNTDAGGAVHAALTSAVGSAPPLRDVRDDAPHRGPYGTFHGFSGEVGSARIDWILQSGFAPVSSEALTAHDGGVWPTDHLPVVARLGWLPPAS